jgi:uncharacterized protein YndB with AHSA1/START domain
MIGVTCPHPTRGADQLILHLERVLPAARPLVFSMCVEPNQLAQWWGPKGFTAPSIELDLRVGGGYRIEMQPPEGDRFFLVGEFREIDAPASLAFTFRWEDPDPDDRETVVTISFGDRGGSTKFSMDQRSFATERRRALHEQGWTEAIDRLHELITNREQPRH